MQCHEKIKENMQEFACSAEVLNLKLYNSVMTDIDAAVNAITFSKSFMLYDATKKMILIMSYIY